MKKNTPLKILITSGSTRGEIDAVRYITNKSTGILGTKIANEALKNRYSVTFIYGKGSFCPGKNQRLKNQRLKLIEIKTVPELILKIKQELRQNKYDAIIHLMAVLDYVPEHYIPEKVSSLKNKWVIKLIKTPKVIKLIRKLTKSAFLVGFKLEVNKPKEKLISIAHQFLLKNKADLVVANDLVQIEKGKYIGHLINKEGEIAIVFSKDALAKKLIKMISV